MLILKAVVLGIIEGITEFLPISSTGHLIVASSMINYPEASRESSELFIQLGAILAVVWHYWTPLSRLPRRAINEDSARMLIAKVLLAFMPAAVAGFFFHHAIEAHLFSPTVVAVSLMVGG